MSCFGLDICGFSQKKYGRIRVVETFCCRAILTFCGVRFGLIFLSALFQWSCFV